MTQEEKAKAYDEAKVRMSRTWNDNRCTIGFMNEIFPEFKINEDERIRKWIIDDIRYNINNEPLNNSEYKKKAEKAIAWLEKQGNQSEQLINKACNILVNCIEDYMLRRMEVWSEECKNQTLENIRKELEK